ncbi:unnamed protein product, partial [Symbiodinium sp. CCMP2456]
PTMKYYEVLAEKIQEEFTLLSGRGDAIPDHYKAAYLVWIPKKGGIATGMNDLRPIGLLTIPAKVLATVVRDEILWQVLRKIQDWPQMGFIPGHGIEDAQARVHAFLEKAAAKALRALGATEDIVSTVRALTEDALYTVTSSGGWTRTTQGVRQGCRVAPLLWSITTIFLMQTTQKAHPRIQLLDTFTAFADDLTLHHIVEKLQDVLDFETALDTLLTTLQDFGMMINFDKTSLMVRLAGPQ